MAEGRQVRLLAVRRYHVYELAADREIHHIGVTSGLLGAVLLVSMAAVSAVGPSLLLSIIVYAGGLVAMLGCSAAYNLAATSPRRERLRRLDHAAIFVMIAGTYTPFTVNCLTGLSAAAVTALIWSLALAGVGFKLYSLRPLDQASPVPYLALGWMGVVTLWLMLPALDRTAIILLATGGVLYSVGTAFHLWERLPFQNAVWHGFVLAGAGFHYAAVLHLVLLGKG